MRLLAVGLSIGGLLLTSACTVSGTVLNVWGPDSTAVTTDCPESYWSISVDQGENNGGITTVCASEGKAKKYKQGDPYP